MPYIGVKTTVALTAEKEMRLKERLGKAVELFPGKTERWLMTGFEDNCRLWFGGTNDKPCAYVEVKVFGKISPAAAEAVTAAVCGIMEEELGVDADRTYVKYEECSLWGWNGTNF